eukprot:1618047-Pyramimonas_sp.AAC.1
MSPFSARALVAEPFCLKSVALIWVRTSPQFCKLEGPSVQLLPPPFMMPPLKASISFTAYSVASAT